MTTFILLTYITLGTAIALVVGFCIRAMSRDDDDPHVLIERAFEERHHVEPPEPWPRSAKVGD